MRTAIFSAPPNFLCVACLYTRADRLKLVKIRRKRSRITRLIIAALCAVILGLLGARLLEGSQPANLIGVKTGAGRALPTHFLGYNANGVSSTWMDPRFFAALKDLQPEVMRYPGGTGANYFNWVSGQYFIDGGTPHFVRINRPVPPSSLRAFTAAVKAAGSAALFDLNVMTYCPEHLDNPQSTSQARRNCTRAQACGPRPSTYTTSCSNTDYTWGLGYQLRLLRTAQQEGVPIKYVELGNELYSGNSDYLYYFPTVRSYIDKINAWIPVIKRTFPGVKVAVVGYSGNLCTHVRRIPRVAAREDAWNTAIYAGVHGEDAVAFHTYYASHLPVNGTVNNAGDVSKLLANAGQDCGNKLRRSVLASLPTNLRAWITEWDLLPDGSALAQGSWAQGLTQAIYALYLLREPQVELATSFDMVSNQVYGAVFYPGGHYVTHVHSNTIRVPTNLPPTLQPFGKSAQGFTLSAMQRALHGATATHALTFSPTPTVAGTTKAGLLGQSFRVGNALNLFFINLSSGSASVNLCNYPDHYEMLQYVSPPNLFVTSNKSVAVTTESIGASVLLPPFSVTSLSATGPASGFVPWRRTRCGL